MQFVSATLIDFTPISWLYVGTAANWVDVDDMQRRSAHTTARHSPLQLSSSSNNKRSNNNNNSNEKPNFCRGAQQRAAAASKWKREQESCTHARTRVCVWVECRVACVSVCGRQRSSNMEDLFLLIIKESTGTKHNALRQTAQIAYGKY